ncbi:hypothetical protein [Malacoplasma muris]|uniref:hypothetical protein n=1 Tax=Malacoplasma muris TaxID=2119 RepID=UPI00398F0E6A
MSIKHKKNSYIDDIIFDSNLDFENRAETDLLIREEAKHLAQKYLAQDKLELASDANNPFASTLEKLEEGTLKNVEEIKRSNDTWEESKNILSRIESKLIDFDNELKQLKYGHNDNNSFDAPLNENNNDVISSIKKTLVENNDSLKEAFGAMINQLSEVINGTKISKTDNVQLKEIDRNDQEIVIQPIQFDDNDVLNEVKVDNEISLEDFEIDDSDLDNKSNKTMNVNSEELDQLKNKQNELVNVQEKLNKEIEIIKKSINDYILASEYSNKTILEQTIDNAHRLSLDVNVVKEQYSNLENEINKIYSTWLDNNQLLTNLENLLIDLSHKNENLVDEKYLYNEEIARKTTDNEKYINEISIESNNLKNSIEKINERLSLVEDLSNSFNPNDYVKNNLTETMIDEVKTISKNIVEEALVERNLFDPKQIITRERVIDEVMDSDIFNYSLEKKIQQTIIDEKLDRKLDESDKLEMLTYTINSDKFKNIISSEVNYVSNDIKLELNDRFTKLRDDFHNTNCYNSNKFIELETKLDSKEDFLQKSEIIEMVFASKELEDIINDKLIYVVNEQLDDLKESMSVIENKILNSVKRYLDEDIQDNLKKEIIDSKDIRQKIKNESLNAIYHELNERDKQYEDQKKEILQNYEALFENNRILENLEKLILKQVEEIEGFKKDKENSFEIAIDKINAQKADIDYLKEKVFEIYGKDLVINSSPEQVYENEVYEKVKQITASLVREEIKKLNLISAANNTNNTPVITNPIFIDDNKEEVSDFFKNRIKDILTKLEENYESVKLDEKIPLADEFKFNLNDLKIDLDDLKESNLNNAVESEDDFGWFYEQEFKAHKEEKEQLGKNSSNLSDDQLFNYSILDDKK